ncbi:hypothetical protein CMK22_05950 [Candidatus Poribacteria bacterium]|nr:hypothetical protein [Candidatus Poribacteria bacterium]
MKLREKILYMSFGAGLVVLGMGLNSLVNVDADAQVSVKDVTFRNVTCQRLIIQDAYMKKAFLGLSSSGDAMLTMYSDNPNYVIAYLGGNEAENNEMMLQLKSKSKTDKRETSIMIDENGGRFDSLNKIGESVNHLAVSGDSDDGLGVSAK